jgi:ketosteroid isomerase-like protein
MMPVRGAATPKELHVLFVEAFNGGDLESLCNLYEPHAAMVPKPHQLARGQQAIRRALQQLISFKGKFVLTSSYVIEVGDVALLRGEWHLNGIGPDGRGFETSGRDIEVARRQSDGTWRFVIDHAFGAS